MHINLGVDINLKRLLFVREIRHLSLQTFVRQIMELYYEQELPL